MDPITEATRRWEEMSENVDTVDLKQNCEAHCNATFASNCVALCYMGLESPFPEGGDMDCDWQDMMYFYRLWRDRGTGANCAYKKRFIKFAVKLVKACRRSPFLEEGPVSVEWLKETELKSAEAEDIESETYVPVVEEEPVKFFNVVDEDKTGLFATLKKRFRRK